MEEVKKLRICCLSDMAGRLNNTRRILQEIETEEIIDVRPDRLSTPNAVYMFINCRDPVHAKGVLADQVIIDMREPMRSIARDILRESCVPEQYQIIDDRRIGTSDKSLW